MAASSFSVGRLLPVAFVLSCLAALGLYAVLAGTGAATVTVFPIPGSVVASPQTQIAFRGLPVDQWGRIVVTGSRSGRHGGHVLSDSDGDGGSFLPTRPFTPGEVVTVRAGLDVLGARRGAFHFTVADPAGPIPNVPLTSAPRVSGDVVEFHSQPDLAPAAVEITKPSATGENGDIFIAPQQGPLQNGPMILAPDGSLVWFHPLPKGDMATDFRVQHYHGSRVLTWWQGYTGAGVGVGEDVIDSSFYRQLAVVRGGNGLSADLHEFLLTPNGTALITAYYPVYWNAAAVHGSEKQIVLDCVVQEIDIPTGLVLFQWDSLDHIPITDSYEPVGGSPGQPYDYFHINSIQREKDGNLVISARNTWAAYEISAETGRVMWTLGGKHSSYKMGPGTAFAFQHDVRFHPGEHSTVTLFDDGAGPPSVQKESRGLTLRLEPKQRRATLVRADRHSPPLLADFEGDTQLLKNGHQFLGWGQQPYFTEFDAAGQPVFDGRFVGNNSSYRAYRFRWTGTPATSPRIAASTRGRTTTVYASWNGATKVSAWRVLAGSAPETLRPTSASPRLGFETELTTDAAAYVAVQALDNQGRVLATSGTVRTS